MDRSEATGFGVAAAGHVALFAALSVGFASTRLPPVKSDPIEVSFVEEVGLESTAPTPSAEAPAPAAPAEAPAELPSEPVPAPVPAPPAPALRAPVSAPTPAPKPVARPAPPKAASPTARPAPPRPATAKTGGRLSLDLSNVRDGPGKSASADPPAAAVGPAVQASLARAVREQLKPHWKAPTGADSELLRTRLSIWLAPNGSVSKIEVIDTSGQTPSNRPQVKLHQEQAIRAVRLAAPFRLPAQYYDAWKFLSPIGFDRKLSQ